MHPASKMIQDRLPIQEADGSNWKKEPAGNKIVPGRLFHNVSILFL